jgi:hypothetical protein
MARAISTYPLNPALALLAPVRTPRTATATPLADVAKPTSEQITFASSIITATHWLEIFEPLMPHALRTTRGLHPGGRKPEMTLKALLTAALLLAIMERPMIIRDVQRLLNFGLDAGSRKHLGLNPKRVITERMVSRAFNLVAAAINPSPYAESNAPLFDAANVKTLTGLSDEEELDQYDHAVFIDEILSNNADRLELFIRSGLRATHPINSGHEGDYALDGSYIFSWERSKTSRRRVSYTDADGNKHKRAARPHELTDADATWW